MKRSSLFLRVGDSVRRVVHMEFDISHQGGKAQLAIKQGAVTLPEGLEQAKISLAQAAANISWQIKPANNKSADAQEPEISVQVKQGLARNADASAEFNGT